MDDAAVAAFGRSGWSRRDGQTDVSCGRGRSAFAAGRGSDDAGKPAFWQIRWVVPRSARQTVGPVSFRAGSSANSRDPARQQHTRRAERLSCAKVSSHCEVSPHGEGSVSFTMLVDSTGSVTNLSFGGAPLLLESAVKNASSSWKLPETSLREVHAVVEFSSNCLPQSK
jgi:hypothetical protein